MGGRWIAGTGQLILGFAGAAMILVWFFKEMSQYYGLISGEVEPRPVGWIGETGAALLGLSWLWALATSISLLSRAKKDDPPQFPAPPANLPDKPPRLP